MTLCRFYLEKSLGRGAVWHILISSCRIASNFHAECISISISISESNFHAEHLKAASLILSSSLHLPCSIKVVQLLCMVWLNQCFQVLSEQHFNVNGRSHDNNTISATQGNSCNKQTNATIGVPLCTPRYAQMSLLAT